MNILKTFPASSDMHQTLPSPLRRPLAGLAAIACLAVPVSLSGDDSNVTVPIEVPGRSFTVEVPQPPAVVVESKKPQNIDTSAEPVDEGDKSTVAGPPEVATPSVVAPAVTSVAADKAVEPAGKRKPKPKAAEGLTLPETVEGDPGAFISVPATTEGKVVKWKAVDLGLNLFPVALLKDTHTAVVTARQAGRYRLLAYTSINDVPSDPAITTVIVGDAPPIPPPVPPGPTPGPDLKGFAKQVYDASAGLDKATVTQAAGAYGSQVSAINAGAYNALGIDKAKEAIANAIAEANPPRQNAKTLFDLIDGELQRREESGQFASLAAVSAALAEITAGLEARTR